MAGDVHVEAPVVRVLAGRAEGAEVGLAAVDGVVAGLMQELYEARGLETALYAGRLAHAVDVPGGKGDAFVLTIGTFVALERPVRHAVAGGIGARNERAAAGRTDGAGVGLREEHTLGSEALHVGRMEHAIIGRGVRPEGNGGVLPAHIVHEEEDDVGTVAGIGGRGRC